MKRIIPLVLGLSLLAVPSASNATTNALAESGRFGLGIGSLRSVSGLSGKFFLSESMAVQGVVGSYWGGGWGWGWGGGLGIGADLLWEMPSLFEQNELNINWNVGAGASAGLGSGVQTFGVSGVAGISLQLKPVPLDVAFELRPTIQFANVSGVDSGIGFGFGVGGHVRYYF